MLLVSLFPGSENFDYLVKVTFIKQLLLKTCPLYLINVVSTFGKIH